MSKIYNNLFDLIGRTPLVRLSSYEQLVESKGNIIAKLEFYNPGGSVKDRVAKYMIEAGEREGIISKDTVIIEATSGNTGIGLAAAGASRGYRVIIVMPETMSIERRNLMAAYGAEIVLTDGKKGMKGAIEKAVELTESIPDSYMPGQFSNYSNPVAHLEGTGPEIWEDTEGKVDIFVAGIGTGGTITGVGQYLKNKNPHVQIIGVEPLDSPVLSEGRSGAHKIQGIGAGFIPEILNTEIYDEIIKVGNEEAFAARRLVSEKEGILVGISSGAALHAAGVIAARNENKGKNIVVLLPDTGERYLSVPDFL